MIILLRIVSSYTDEKNISGSPDNTELRKGKVIDKFINGHPCKGKKILILRTSSRLPNKKRSTEVAIYDVSTGLRRNMCRHELYISLITYLPYNFQKTNPKIWKY